MKNNWHKTFLEIAKLISYHSKAKNNKVGCVLVKDNKIISIGYNGTPHGFSNICEINGVTKKEVLHAESNCISKCAKSTESSYNSILYVTLSPCIECAKLIIQSGIKEVYFFEQYRDDAGLKLLKKANIKYYKV
jgi:dCMP deaminase